MDKCGVCGGGDKDLGCDGVCFSGKVPDSCGVCGGDGSSCIQCEQVLVAGEVGVSASNMTASRARGVVKQMNRSYIDRAAKQCNTNLRRFTRQANAVVAQMEKLLQEEFQSVVNRCTNSVCTKSSTTATKKQLRKLTKRLDNIQKSAKLASIEACDVKHDPSREDPRTPRKEYINRLLDSIKQLPGEVLECSEALRIAL